MRAPLFLVVPIVVVCSLVATIAFAEAPSTDSHHDSSNASMPEAMPEAMSGAMSESMSDHMERVHADDPQPASGALGKAVAATASAPSDLIVQVNGIVCSFCAYGLEKALSKLDGLDRSRHGNGILVDIEAQLVTLAFVSGADFQFAEVHRRIVKAGYDPVRFDFQLVGRLGKGEGGWSVQDAPSHARYELDAEDVIRLALVDGAQVDRAVSIDAKQTSRLESGQPVRVRLNASQ